MWKFLRKVSFFRSIQEFICETLERKKRKWKQLTIIEIGNVENYGQISRAVKFPRGLCSIIKSKKEKRLYKKNRIFLFFSFFSFFFQFTCVSPQAATKHTRKMAATAVDVRVSMPLHKILYCETRIYIKRGVLTAKLLLQMWNSEAGKSRYYHFYNDNDNGYSNANVHINNKCSV